MEYARVTDVASDEESGALPLLTERDAHISQRKKSTQLSQKKDVLNSQRKKST